MFKGLNTYNPSVNSTATAVVAAAAAAKVVVLLIVMVVEITTYPHHLSPRLLPQPKPHHRPAAQKSYYPHGFNSINVDVVPYK
jgi:hypothetical protein